MGAAGVAGMPRSTRRAHAATARPLAHTRKAASSFPLPPQLCTLFAAPVDGMQGSSSTELLPATPATADACRSPPLLIALHADPAYPHSCSLLLPPLLQHKA